MKKVLVVLGVVFGVGVLGLIGLVALGAMFAGSVAEEVGENNSNIVAGESESDEPEQEPTETVKEEPDVPREYISALNQADTYANTMHMSEKGLFDQLTSEYGGQFSDEAAQYAVDNVEANWKENALEKAKTYQNEMNMSPDAIHDQLTAEFGEQFTKAEADYAIENLNK
jgi:hypothetical protein